MAKKPQKLTDKYVTRRTVRWFWIIVAAPFALVSFLLLLTSTGLFGRLPSFEELENPKSNIATEVYSEDGEMIGSFYVQNRSYVGYDELSPYLVAALVSTEDARYYSHSGIDFPALARVAIKTVAMLDRGQGGGSTITQQLAKNLFPRDTVYRSSIARKGRTVIFKLKEWITAVKLEYNYTKEEIIAMYLNTVLFGSNAYGIKSAAHTFFGKTPTNVNMQEAAMLVGMVNAPTAYNPKINYDRALTRRNTVISRIQTQGYITRHERDSLQALPVDLTKYKPITHNEGTGTYFREMLRLVMTAPKPTRSRYATDWDYQYELAEWERNPLYGWCSKNTKADGTPYNIYRDGIKIFTTINSSMQRYAEQAVVEQLTSEVQPAMDAQYARTGILFNNITKDQQARIVRNAMRYSDRYRVMKAAGATEEQIETAFDTPTDLRVFTYGGERDTLLTPRDSILHHKRIMRAAFMALDPTTGHVKAYVGGPNYRYFKYDMVRQGKRQVGSTIKPFIYTFAINQLGYTPCTMVPNQQTVIETANGEPWSPKEAGKVVYDEVLHPLRWGLALSRNNYSAWIMKQAHQPAAVADFIHKLGIHSYIDPVYALCLGTPDVSLWEMAATYSIYANRGVYTEPIFVTRIEDRHGNLISSFTATTKDAISEQTAYTMLDMLKFVVSNGTAGRLRWGFGVNGEVGGKTGTTQNNADAWFMGVAPKLVAGTWVGAEDPSVHIYARAEGSVMALPIYGRFMQLVYGDARMQVTAADRFPVPVGVVDYDCASEESSGDEMTVDPDGFFD
jgi:penicillin-binding protein 1A